MHFLLAYCYILKSLSLLERIPDLHENVPAVVCVMRPPFSKTAFQPQCSMCALKK